MSNVTRPPPPQEVFPAFFRAFLSLKSASVELRMHERITYLLFAINAFQVGRRGGMMGSGPGDAC